MVLTRLDQLAMWDSLPPHRRQRNRQADFLAKRIDKTVREGQSSHVRLMEPMQLRQRQKHQE